MKIDTTNIRTLATTVRMLSVDGVEQANSGHPGLPMGAADYASVLWAYFLRFNPHCPEWQGRDRFVLSAGHGSMLLYSLLHLFGYGLPLDELRRFRQWGSRTPGHPEFGVTPGVETTTGPLGQGFANGVGMALSGKLLSQRYGEDLFGYRVYGIVSDGDLMEGISSEAASFAGHLGLGNLIYFYDDNKISIGGSTRVCFTENVGSRFESYGWSVQKIDAHNPEEAALAIERAQGVTDRPSLIIAHSTIGYGSPNKANTPEVHGSPLGKDEREEARKFFQWPSEDFHVPAEVKAFCASVVENRILEHEQWDRSMAGWRSANPEKAKQLDSQTEREVPEGLERDLVKEFSTSKKDATRNLSGQVLQVIARHVPCLVGGSADLEPSTKTLIKGSPDIEAGEFSGRNIRFGVREHAMGGVANGLAYTKAWIPYTATFLVFSDYMRPAVRLAAISEIQTLFIFTHDSFYVGEDGPTHEPIEHIASLRLIPNLYVFRPADALETAMCYLAALRLKSRPSTILLTRQNVVPVERPSGFVAQDIMRGAYIVANPDVEDLVIVATGSEVSLALDAARLLEKGGRRARVVSMPCVEQFMEQEGKLREALIPSKARKVSIEAGVTAGWQSLLGLDSLNIGLDHFGASAPADVLAGKFGFTPEAVSGRIGDWMKRV